MARIMKDDSLGFIRCKEVYPPRTPKISGRYLDRWVGVWEDACKSNNGFELMARDLGEFWLLDQFFTNGIKGYVQSEAGMWFTETPVSLLESAVFHASYARHPNHIRNLDMKRSSLFANLHNAVLSMRPDALQQLGQRASVYRADLADTLFDVGHGMQVSDILGAGTLRKYQPQPPDGWVQRLGLQ